MGGSIKPDCRFLYFKPSGKWKYEGRGVFPRPPVPGKYYDVDRTAIMRANRGQMPGITSDAADMFVIVIPDEGCTVETAYPRMLHPVVSEKMEIENFIRSTT
jgi:hypothetical protein